jgi:hypothetical protein
MLSLYYATASTSNCHDDRCSAPRRFSPAAAPPGDRCACRSAAAGAAAAGHRPDRRRRAGGRRGVVPRAAPEDGRRVPALATGEPVGRRGHRGAVPRRQPSEVRRAPVRRVLRAAGPRRARPRRAPDRGARQSGEPLLRVRRVRGGRRVPPRVAGARAHVLRPGAAQRHGGAGDRPHGRRHPRQLLRGHPGAPAGGRAALPGRGAERQRHRDERGGRDQHLPRVGPGPLRARRWGSWRRRRRRWRRRWGRDGYRGGQQVEAGAVRRGAGRGRHRASGDGRRGRGKHPAAQVGDGGDGASGLRGRGAARVHGRTRARAVSGRFAHHAGRARERVLCHVVTQCRLETLEGKQLFVI